MGNSCQTLKYHHAGGKKTSSNYKSKDDRLGMGSGNRGNGTEPHTATAENKNEIIEITFDYRDYIEDGFNAGEVLEECDGVPWGHYFVEDRAAQPLFECPWMEIN